MSNEAWTQVDDYLDELFAPSDDVLAEAAAACAEAGLPPISVTATQGKMLHVLARALSARRILEIGTLGGLSAIWLGRALAPGGHLVTLEMDERHAGVARANLSRAGLADSAQVLLGPAADSLAKLAHDGAEPFDLIFIDADKSGYPGYLAASLRLSRPGTLIIADNVIRGGAITDPGSADPAVLGVREFLALLAAEPRVAATAIQTVGAKGHDGYAMALVLR